MNHIVLIGFMGTGKTTIGKGLANSLTINFIDLDTEIEKETNQTINSIFINKGEQYFRDAEEIALQKAINKQERSIISTGGGIVLREANRDLMKNHYVILLEANTEVIYQRLRNQQDRPLLKVDDPEDEIKRLYQHREKLYKELADITINTNDKNVNNIIAEIIKSLPPTVLQ